MAANYLQASATGTPSIALPAQATRKFAIIQNNDASATLYAGANASMTTGANSVQIGAGKSRPFHDAGAVYVMTGGGTISYDVQDEF